MSTDPQALTSWDLAPGLLQTPAHGLVTLLPQGVWAGPPLCTVPSPGGTLSIPPLVGHLPT